MPLFVSVIIAAAGRGQRLGGSQPKQLLAIGGRAVLDRSVSAFVAHPRVRQIVVALPPELAASPPAGLTGAAKPIVIVSGGARRQDSVASAFAATDPAADIVLVHDAARPFVSAALIDRTIDAAFEVGAALPAVPARDTVKLAAPGGIVAKTLPREEIFLAQTPQGFRRDVLRDALTLAAREGLEVTDEAALVERAGHPVRLVEGEASNIKITTPDDLPIAEAIAGYRSPDQPRQGDGGPPKPSAEAEGFALQPRGAGPFGPGDRRVGTGYDLHCLAAGRPLVVGGVTIPSGRGAVGHSDADVVCHAVTDAMLGAAGLGDIGGHFPDSDPAWKGASSLDLLARAAAMAAARGFEVDNVDVTVVLEAPKIRDRVEAMRVAIARAIGIEPARVSVKGKTNEGVDAIGRGEAIAAHAVALLRTR